LRRASLTSTRTKNLHHPPSPTSPRTAWRSTSSDTGHSAGTSKSADGCATCMLRTRLMGHRHHSLSRPMARGRRPSCRTGIRRLPPRARMTTFQPETRSRSWLSRTRSAPGVRRPPVAESASCLTESGYIFRDGQLIVTYVPQGVPGPDAVQLRRHAPVRGWSARLGRGPHRPRSCLGSAIKFGLAAPQYPAPGPACPY
jgi:hypothetical protein